MPFLKTFLLFFFSISVLNAQIVKISPSEASADDDIEIIYDASQGTAGLAGASTVYMHSGVVIDNPNGTSWEYVVGNWGKDDGIGKMTKVEGTANQWSIKIPNIRAYYGVAQNVVVFRISMVFRNADGSKEGKGSPGDFDGGSVASNGDIYIDLNVANYVQIVVPSSSNIFLNPGAQQEVKIEASEIATKLSLYLDEGNGFNIVQVVENSKNINTSIAPTKTGKVFLKAEAIFGTDSQVVVKEFQFVIKREVSRSALPNGLKKGVNYSTDHSKVTLVLEAPKKEFVYIVGDFSNWEIHDDLLMNKTPDGDIFWLEIDSLQPKREYVFQYWVDGSIKIPDPYADKIADPWNDQFIPKAVYPNLPTYDRQDFGIASVLQTGQEPFEWDISENNWQNPNKEELIIYELLVRDFIGSHDYKDLIDTLSYLKKLGINTIELMPIMEFEGNESWGYNVSQFFAPDKYYGSKNDLKSFIQTAHQQGFAVLLDMVLNHAFGQNPLVKMYWDSSNNRPSADNPWFNVEAKHLYNVGYDFNHESRYTQAFVDSVNSYWLSEYHFDGFRFDLSKGFTQKQSSTDAQMAAKDDSRIAILKRMASKIRAIDKDAIIILEHFADLAEENLLRADGMMTWGNNNHDFAELMIGKTSQNISTVDDASRVSYMESHDEPRQMYLAKNASLALKSTYDPRKELVALNRLKMMTAFFFTQPGPKMMWQFQELGYDIDINLNGRTGNKPLVWGEGSLNYYTDRERQKLYKTNAAILKLVNQNKEVFKKGRMVKSLSGAIKSLKIEHDSMDVVIIGNFDIKNAQTNFSFPKLGKWYNYFQKDSLELTGSIDFTFSPGEFHVFTSVKQNEIEDSLLSFFEARDTTIVRGKIVTVDPVNFQPDTEITITFDAAEADPSGTAGLVGVDKVYMHAGVITSSESGVDWQYVKGNWGMDNGIGQMTKMPGESNKWQISFQAKTYFSGVPASAKWYRIGMVFRNADGSREGKGLGASDIFINFSEKEIDSTVLAREPIEHVGIYPNPSEAFFIIEGIADIKNVWLLNAKGQCIKQYHSQPEYKLNGIENGLYVLLIETNNGLLSKRLIVH